MFVLELGSRHNNGFKHMRIVMSVFWMEKLFNKVDVPTGNAAVDVQEPIVGSRMLVAIGTD